eukprot:TRINITY_DN420_c0_g1_i4.p2 TRINITY_DN420_c0_g1~~TRINITY_DN420_c0_g1_i4.p2  ORF type:complete len:246 (-),score=70.13 TRINITY_DN420_c0_g1_i4:94-831(-)
MTSQPSPSSPSLSSPSSSPSIQKEVEIPLPGTQSVLQGYLTITPDVAQGIVIFIQCSGSRYSKMNKYLSEYIQEGGKLATLCIDLLTPIEEVQDHSDACFRFNVDMLSDRLSVITSWVSNCPSLRSLTIGYCATETGAAAAIVTSSSIISNISIKAIVCRGGRPDLAGKSLQKNKTPTLMIVGGDDGVFVRLNKKAYDRTMCEKQMAIIPRASHLFEEPGKQEQVARLAKVWLEGRLIIPGGAAM